MAKARPIDHRNPSPEPANFVSIARMRAIKLGAAPSMKTAQFNNSRSKPHAAGSVNRPARKLATDYSPDLQVGVTAVRSACRICQLWVAATNEKRPTRSSRQFQGADD